MVGVVKLREKATGEMKEFTCYMGAKQEIKGKQEFFEETYREYDDYDGNARGGGSYDGIARGGGGSIRYASVASFA